jgi:hypothetical protein
LKNATEKTFALTLGSSYKLCFPDEFKLIKQVQSLRILGVIFDTKLSFTDNVVEIISYVKRFKYAINYLRVQAKLSDSMLFQVLCAIRTKFSYGLFWWPYISDSNSKILSRWWGNLCRVASGASKLVDRRLVLAAVGLSDVVNWIDFALFLRLLKKRFSFVVEQVKNPPSWSYHSGPGATTPPPLGRGVMTNKKDSHTFTIILIKL